MRTEAEIEAELKVNMDKRHELLDELQEVVAKKKAEEQATLFGDTPNDDIKFKLVYTLKGESICSKKRHELMEYYLDYNKCEVEDVRVLRDRDLVECYEADVLEGPEDYKGAYWDEEECNCELEML
jgi:hypothetical protein